MYVRTRPLDRPAVSQTAVWPVFRVGGYHLCILLLTIVCVATSFSLVYCKDLYRRLFVQQQHLLRLQHNMQVHWEKLLLERAAISSDRRIRKRVSDRLTMHVPRRSEMVLVSFKDDGGVRG